MEPTTSTQNHQQVMALAIYKASWQSKPIQNDVTFSVEFGTRVWGINPQGQSSYPLKPCTMAYT